VIQPTEKDIGTKVVYSATGEWGEITSFNDTYVFVRFNGQPPDADGKACHARNLFREAFKPSAAALRKGSFSRREAIEDLTLIELLGAELESRQAEKPQGGTMKIWSEKAAGKKVDDPKCPKCGGVCAAALVGLWCVVCGERAYG